MLRRKAEVFAPTDGVLDLVVGLDAAEAGVDYSDPVTWAETVHPLAYRRMRISSRDVELAQATGSEITAKVEVRHAPGLGVMVDAVLDGAPYEITRVEDRGATCWLWLSEIACDGTCTLVKKTVTYDALAIPEESETYTPVYVRRVELSSKLVTRSGVDGLDALCTMRLRAADYDGERTVMRGGTTYTVVTAEGHGRWVDLTCRERGSDR